MSTENFDELVSGISKNERQKMLDNIQRKSQEFNSSNNIKDDLSQEREDALKKKFVQLSFFQKIFLWFLSIIRGADVESVFNSHLLSKNALYLEQQFPGILDYKRGLLLNGFYEKILQLRNNLAFFSEYISYYEENRSKFYVYLSTIIMPEVADEIIEKSDPFQYPFTKELNNEMRNSLLSKLEDIVNSISQDKRNDMYLCIKSIEWLSNTIKLPLNKILLKFIANEKGQKECPINQLSTELIALAKFFNEEVFLPTEIIRALYFFRNEIEKKDNFQQSVDQADQELNKFISEAEAKILIIKSFPRFIPVADLAKLATNDSQFAPSVFGGGEDWLSQFRAEQKVIFENKWNSWLIEYKKEKVRHKLSEYFSIMSFPSLPLTPWKDYKEEVKFGNEYTIGFIYNFIKNYINPSMPTLKTLSVEGDFYIKENRLELIEGYNSYEKLDADLNALEAALMPSGEYGIMFENISNNGYDYRTRLDAVKEVVSEIEKNTQQLIADFGKLSRSMTNLLSAALGELSSQFYGPVTNIYKIAGGGNKIFRENLYNLRNNIEHSFAMLSEMEALDIDNKK